MSFTGKLMQVYFDYAYNPVYDFTTAQLYRYRQLQKRCVDKFKLEDNDKVLCVGLGTGNEIYHILQKNKRVVIVGVDSSRTALKKASKKALRLGKEIEVYIMNAKWLEFTTGSFDAVLCLHVMDFVDDVEKVTSEILRVLKNDGQFVITYPSGKEDVKLAYNLLKDNIRHNVNSGKNYIRISLELLLQTLLGIVCLPMGLRPKKRFYSRNELEEILTASKAGSFLVEEYPLYHDFIIYGKK